MHTYIVYDSRAGAGDIDEASVLEIFEADNDVEAIKEARESWASQRAIVYKYDIDPKNPKQLTNETYVGCVDDYKSFPKRRK